MKVLNIILGFAASFLAAFVLQYGFNNLAIDFIKFRKISYFEAFIILELFSFILFLANVKDFKIQEDETEQNLYNIIFKIVGYVFFLIFFAVLVYLK